MNEDDYKLYIEAMLKNGTFQIDKLALAYQILLHAYREKK